MPDPHKDQSTPVHTFQCLVGKNGLDFVYFFACIWHVLYLFYELYTLIIGKIVKTDNIFFIFLSKLSKLKIHKNAGKKSSSIWFELFFPAF